jgi:FdhE protein
MVPATRGVGLARAAAARLRRQVEVRQGEVAPKGTWTGSPLGRVKAPDALILPDPATRFARTATRLEDLSATHPMADWLRFVATLAHAQHVAVATVEPVAAPVLPAIRHAVEAGMPPLAADGHRRDPAWRTALGLLLDRCGDGDAPPPARLVVDDLKARGAVDLEALADAFLRGTVAPADIGPTLYVAAALQVYFTVIAAALPAEALRLLTQRGLCPCCGSTPVAGVVTGSGQTPGVRYLHCSLCATAWNHVRAVCITCGGSRSVSLRAIDGDNGAVKAETCGDCHTYAKMLYQAKDMEVDPVADDLASLGLDMLVAEAGWSRHAPNPLLLVG